MYGIAVLYVVLFEELCVPESLSLEEKALGVCGRSTGLCGEVGFDVGDGVGVLNGERKGAGGL